MRDMFRGYYQPTDEEMAAIWQDGLISLDANVLLSLYNVQEATSALYLEAMEQRKPQMWIPHQVALEFHRNVHKERAKQTAAHQNRIKQIEGLIGDLRSTARKSRLTASEAQRKAVDSLNDLKAELLAERDAIAEQTNHRTPDMLLERIAKLFDGQVGAEPEEAALNAMFKDGEKRFADEVPPGFEDAKTKTGNRKYGDYVLWRQLMNHASNMKRDVIFVTDDDKADWWLKIEKTSVAPRPELIQEFRSVTGQDILILNSSQFYYKLVPAAEGDTTRTEQVKAAQEDMEAAVSEAKETTSIYERLQDRWGVDYKHVAEFISSPTGTAVQAYLENRYNEGLSPLERLGNEAAPSAAKRAAQRAAERVRIAAELETLRQRRNELEYLLQGAASSTDALRLQRVLDETLSTLDSVLRRQADLDSEQ